MAEQAPSRLGHRASECRSGRRHASPMPASSGESRIGAVLVESVPNVSEGRRLDVVDRLAEALDVRARRLPPRPDVRREPQPLGVHGRGRARARSPQALERAGRAGARRDRHGDAHGRAPADRRGRRHPVRAARRHDDGRLRRAGPRRSARGSPARWDLPGLPLRAGGDPRRPGASSPTSGAASTRASRPRSRTTAASPTSGPRGCTREPARWPSARGRSSSPGTSTSTRTTSSSPSGSRAASASRAAACRGSRRTGSGSRSRSAAIRSAPRSR